MVWRDAGVISLYIMVLICMFIIRYVRPKELLPPCSTKFQPLQIFLLPARTAVAVLNKQETAQVAKHVPCGNGQLGL